MTEIDIERFDRICALKGIRQEDLRTWPDGYDGAPSWAQWHATVGPFDLGCTVGTGPTPEAAIDDLLDQLETP
jgi:hypothetical protein